MPGRRRLRRWMRAPKNREGAANTAAGLSHAPGRWRINRFVARTGPLGGSTDSPMIACEAVKSTNRATISWCSRMRHPPYLGVESALKPSTRQYLSQVSLEKPYGSKVGRPTAKYQEGRNIGSSVAIVTSERLESCSPKNMPLLGASRRWRTVSSVSQSVSLEGIARRCRDTLRQAYRLVAGPSCLAA